MIKLFIYLGLVKTDATDLITNFLNVNASDEDNEDYKQIIISLRPKLHDWNVSLLMLSFRDLIVHCPLTSCDQVKRL